MGETSMSRHSAIDKWLKSTLLAATILAGMMPGLALAKGDGLPAIDADLEVDRPLVIQGADDAIYILVRFKARDEDISDEDRPAVNFGMVLDRSGSMSDGGKMEFLKPAARMAVDRLTKRDYLSVVEYDDAITVMWPGQIVRDTRELKRLIDNLEPRGSTNLGGGLERGIAEVDDVRRQRDLEDGTINRVLLLSDGLANVGMVDPREIGEMVQAARRKGIRVSAMGLGRDYDEDLMQRIAEMGGGNYYYVEHPKQLSRIFEQELMTAFSTSAKDIRFEFEGTGLVRKAEVIGYEEGSDPRRLGLDWEDFFAGEERSLVLRIEADTGALGAADLGDLKLTYMDVGDAQPRTINADIRVDITADRSAADAAVNKRARAEAVLVESDRAHEEAVSLYEQGKVEEAEARMADLERDLKTENVSLGDDRLRNKIESLSVEQSQMASAAPSPEAQADYLKGSKQRLYEARQGKRALSMLQIGDKGLEVEQLQQALKDAGAYSGPVDGVFTTEVKAAVEKYQNTQNLPVDGIAGPATMDKLGMY